MKAGRWVFAHPATLTTIRTQEVQIMATENRTGDAIANTQGQTRLQSSPKEALAATIREIDDECGRECRDIEALAHGADALLAAESECMPEWRRESIRKMLDMIALKACMLANAVNYGAEQVGCNHIEGAQDVHH